MPEVVELERPAVASCAVGDRVAVQQHPRWCGRCGRSSQTAGTSISPAWLRASHSSREGCVANGIQAITPISTSVRVSCSTPCRRALLVSRARIRASRSPCSARSSSSGLPARSISS